METIFIGEEYVALSLIKIKNQFLGENFITISELNQFEHFLQQEFNNSIIFLSTCLCPTG